MRFNTPPTFQYSYKKFIKPTLQMKNLRVIVLGHFPKVMRLVKEKSALNLSSAPLFLVFCASPLQNISRDKKSGLHFQITDSSPKGER